jgi:DNA mismatch endonuclease (patch repair protein)
MVDVVSKEKRSKMMAGIKGKDTKPEIMLRKELYRRGYRYRIHGKGIEGRPDIVVRKYNALVFVHGCFWHGHKNCKLFRIPKSKVEFWTNKIGGNTERDKHKMQSLIDDGWRILIVWECAVKGRKERIPLTADLVEKWLSENEDGLTEIKMDQEAGIPVRH